MSGLSVTNVGVLDCLAFFKRGTKAFQEVLTDNLYYVATLINPKTKGLVSIFCATAQSGQERPILMIQSRDSLQQAKVLGTGMLDEEYAVAQMGCFKPHVGDVSTKGQALGLMMYLGLVLTAAIVEEESQEYEACIASRAGDRSADAEAWWKRQLQEKLVLVEDDLYILALENVLSTGLILHVNDYLQQKLEIEPPSLELVLQLDMAYYDKGKIREGRVSWGLTNEILNLLEELDASPQIIEDSIAKYVGGKFAQKRWDKKATVYPTFQYHPVEQLRRRLFRH